MVICTHDWQGTGSPGSPHLRIYIGYDSLSLSVGSGVFYHFDQDLLRPSFFLGVADINFNLLSPFPRILHRPKMEKVGGGLWPWYQGAIHWPSHIASLDIHIKHQRLYSDTCYGWPVFLYVAMVQEQLNKRVFLFPFPKTHGYREQHNDHFGCQKLGC